MIEKLLSGIWWMDALRLFGIGFLALLFLGIPGWMFASKLRWRRKDAEEMAATLERIQMASASGHDVGIEKPEAVERG